MSKWSYIRSYIPINNTNCKYTYYSHSCTFTWLPICETRCEIWRDTVLYNFVKNSIYTIDTFHIWDKESVYCVDRVFNRVIQCCISIFHIWFCCEHGLFIACAVLYVTLQCAILKQSICIVACQRTLQQSTASISYSYIFNY